MEIMEVTKKQQRKYDRTKILEELKREIVLLKAKLFNKPISQDDSRTLQVHEDSQGMLRDYYIANPYLQNGASYRCVNPIIEDSENNRFIYRGMIPGADNAIGIIESNVSLSEIVASADGNIKLQEMLKQENAELVRDQYYIQIGEKLIPLKGHTTFFGKPDFALGTIHKEENGKFNSSSQINPATEKILQEEREHNRKTQVMRQDEATEIDLGGGLVVANQDCWLDQGKKLRFSGINEEALQYQYMPESPIKTEDNRYVYIGEVKIGKVSKAEAGSNELDKMVRPFKYSNVVIWTDKTNLVQYFLDKKFAGLNFALGSIFSSQNISNKENEEAIFAGGITIDDKGECEKYKEIPESVTKVVEEYMAQEKSNNIVNFKGMAKDD